MRSLLIAAAGTACAALLLTAGPAQAQAPSRGAITVNRGAFELEAFGGYLVTESFAEGPLGTSIGSASAPLYGVQAGLPLAPGASLMASLAYASGNLQAGVPILGGIRIGDSNTTLFDASVQLRFDSWEARNARVIPFAQLGGGAIHREVSISGFTAKTTDFAVSGALGADIPIMKDVSLRVMAKDHWGKADFGSVGSLDIKTKDMHALALTGGVRVTF